MATIKLTIIPAKKLKNGSHKIRIAICHKQVTSYIVTRFVIDSESQFKNGQVVNRNDAAIINTKLRNLLNLYQEKLDNIRNIGLYTSAQLKNMLENSSSDEIPTFAEICKLYIKTLLENNQKGYAGIMDRSLRKFTEFTNGDLLITDINKDIISNYDKFLRKKSLSKASISIELRNIKTIINRAIKEHNVIIQEHPFNSIKISASRVRDICVSVETINMIRLSNPTSKKLVMARDLFCLSFYLGGINLIDLLDIDFRNMNIISYIRQKAKNMTDEQVVTSFDIPECAKPIIKRWINNKTGKLDFGYKLSYNNFRSYLSKCIQKMCEELGIKEKVVYYSARKTFAQMASELGVPDSIIDYCLGHSDTSRGVIRYYTKVRKQQASCVINLVIDYVNNPDKYDISNLQYIKLIKGE